MTSNPGSVKRATAPCTKRIREKGSSKKPWPQSDMDDRFRARIAVAAIGNVRERLVVVLETASAGE